MKSALNTLKLIPLWCAGALIAAGCQQMADQPSYRPFQPSKFYPDDRSARPLVPGTVARGHLQIDKAFFTGKREAPFNGQQAAGIVGAAGTPFTGAAFAVSASPYVETFPLAITKKLMARGQERFNIYCAVCHDRAGTGRGMVVLRGFAEPPSYHIPRLRKAPAGYLYHVIKNGYGAMPEHGSLVPPHDRWAIVAYVRALQLSQDAEIDDVPEDKRKKLK